MMRHRCSGATAYWQRRYVSKKSSICVSVSNQVGFVLKVIIGLQSRQVGCRNIGWRISRLVVILRWENTGVRFCSPQKETLVHINK